MFDDYMASTNKSSSNKTVLRLTQKLSSFGQAWKPN